ncbi:protein FAM200C-like [Oratosquilla oratoria]|uniref:protein FAM200C-like n=1 Tax=Oratosquilla oratoria TaxID=337810 RepID=UPI003F773A1C
MFAPNLYCRRPTAPGITSNETVDLLAKAACEQPSPAADSSPSSLSFYRRKISAAAHLPIVHRRNIERPSSIQNIKYFAMSAKKRKYIEDYIRFGFVSLQRGDTEVPLCVICYKTLSNDGMRPSRLERHLRTSHPALVDKPKAFFETKKDTLKRAKLDDSGSFRQQSSKVLEASYEIAMLIAKSKKSHNIGESLIKPSILCAAELVLGKDSANKLSQISLSNDTVKKRIDELSQDIKVQTLDQVRASPVFAIQCDETTDVAQCSQLLMYARFVSGNNIKEEIMFCHPMESFTTAEAIFDVISDFFQENQLSWESLVGVCTDGAPAMRGLRSGFVTKVKERNPSVMSTHCILHQEALASRTLPVEMMDVLNVAIKIVNFVKAGALNSRLFKLLCKDMESEHEALLFHTNVRWLSKGNMLGRLYELREEVEIFLDSQQKVDLYDKFQSEGFHATLAYLVDIFEALNAVNLKLQGKNINILVHHDTIRTFMAKLDLWKCRVLQGNVASFRNLDTALADNDKREAWKFTRNPFQCEVADVAEEVQEEFLELKFDSTAKEDFKDMDLETFWVKYLHVYPLTSHQALRILTMFGSTYMCETVFSTLVSIKTKYRNRLNVEGDLRCALSSIRPRSHRHRVDYQDHRIKVARGRYIPFRDIQTGRTLAELRRDAYPAVFSARSEIPTVTRQFPPIATKASSEVRIRARLNPLPPPTVDAKFNLFDVTVRCLVEAQGDRVR